MYPVVTKQLHTKLPAMLNCEIFKVFHSFHQIFTSVCACMSIRSTRKNNSEKLRHILVLVTLLALYVFTVSVKLKMSTNEKKDFPRKIGCATQYEIIVVNGQTTTFAFHKVV